MKKIFHQIKRLAFKHKIISFIVVAAIAYGGYWGYQKFNGNAGQTQYVTANVRKGAVIVSITGSGQVSASSQSDIKSKVSGDTVYVGVKNGQEVWAGTLIVQLDARDAQKTVRDAEANLESAKISLEKLKKPADNLSIIQAENTLARAKESKQKAEDDLKKAREDGFNNTANAFLDLPSIITGLQDMLFTTNRSLSSGGQWSIDYYDSAARKYNDKASQFKTDAADKYQTARTSYEKNFQDYKSTDRTSDDSAVESLVNQTYETAKNIAEAVKSANNLIQLYEDELTKVNIKPAALADTHLSTLNAYTGKTNTHLLNLLSAKNTIENDKTAITNSDRAIAESSESLAKLKLGADALDIESSKLTVKQRENALLDAKEKLDDYFIRAPFDGTIAKINVKKTDSISGSATIATLVTKQKMAEISLNEIDAAKIKVGQKTTLTFDAIEGLRINGEVAEIDAVGTVAQGVVTYTVKITFDTQDDRVKPGMSVSAEIVTDTARDVLIVPNSAVKSQGKTRYVEMFDQPIPQNKNGQAVPSPIPPRRQTVEIGLSNDTFTEIISGLNEGDQVVARTTSGSSSSQSAAQAPTSLFGNPAGGRGGGGIRIPR